ncbi:MAG: hypothetical protein ABMA13_22860 [Chthoniobacteraceae bacterium]
MSRILRDQDIKKLIGTVILDGDARSIRPNCYVVRLGKEGEFLNVQKQFTLGSKTKGLKLPPGHSVALTARETLDFRPETIGKVFAGHALHALVTPTTDLAREGLVTPTGQIDSGYHGTLNFTVTNTSGEERMFLYEERLVRIVFFLLEGAEIPDAHYDGEYHQQIGYVRSRRKGPPAGMRSDEWETAVVDGSPEDHLDQLIKAGYPWGMLGTRLKIIDRQFQTVSNEYSEIQDTLEKVETKLNELSRQSDEITRDLAGTVKSVLDEQSDHLQNRWMIVSATMIGGVIGLWLTLAKSEEATAFIARFGAITGIVLLLVCVIVGLFLLRGKRK